MKDKGFSADDAERSLLGGLLLDNDAGILGSASPTSEHFGDSRHRHVYEAMLALHEDGEPIDRVTLKGRLAERGNLDTVG
jgi:replicative DNA helicase